MQRTNPLPQPADRHEMRVKDVIQRQMPSLLATGAIIAVSRCFSITYPSAHIFGAITLISASTCIELNQNGEFPSKKQLAKSIPQVVTDQRYPLLAAALVWVGAMYLTQSRDLALFTGGCALLSTALLKGNDNYGTLRGRIKKLEKDPLVLGFHRSLWAISLSTTLFVALQMFPTSRKFALKAGGGALITGVGLEALFNVNESIQTSNLRKQAKDVEKDLMGKFGIYDRITMHAWTAVAGLTAFALLASFAKSRAYAPFGGIGLFSTALIYDVTTSQETKSLSGVARKKSTPPRPDQMKLWFKKEGIEFVSSPIDGSCLFHSIVTGAQSVGIETSAEELRQQVAARIRQWVAEEEFLPDNHWRGQVRQVIQTFLLECAQNPGQGMGASRTLLHTLNHLTQGPTSLEAIAAAAHENTVDDERRVQIFRQVEQLMPWENYEQVAAVIPQLFDTWQQLKLELADNLELYINTGTPLGLAVIRQMGDAYVDATQAAQWLRDLRDHNALCEFLPCVHDYGDIAEQVAQFKTLTNIKDDRQAFELLYNLAQAHSDPTYYTDPIKLLAGLIRHVAGEDRELVFPILDKVRDARNFARAVASITADCTQREGAVQKTNQLIAYVRYAQVAQHIPSLFATLHRLKLDLSQTVAQEIEEDTPFGHAVREQLGNQYVDPAAAATWFANLSDHEALNRFLPLVRNNAAMESQVAQIVELARLANHDVVYNLMNDLALEISGQPLTAMIYHLAGGDRELLLPLPEGEQADQELTKICRAFVAAGDERAKNVYPRLQTVESDDAISLTRLRNMGRALQIDMEPIIAKITRPRLEEWVYSEEEEKGWQAYLASTAQEGTWGSGFEQDAACEILDLSIWTIKSPGPPFNAATDTPIMLSLGHGTGRSHEIAVYHSGGHYSGLRLPQNYPLKPNDGKKSGV